MTDEAARKERIKQDFIDARGYWSKGWDPLLDMSPDYFAAYAKLSSVPWTAGTLDPKIKEFLYIAIDASTTHMFEPGLRIHIRNALRYGATQDEIMEVLQITSSIGVHTVTESVPLLLDAMKATGHALPSPDLDARRKALKDAFVANRGYWSPMWDSVLALDPDYFEAYLDFSSVPWKHGVLEPKVKEMIYIAVSVASQCNYCIASHTAAARKGGMSDEMFKELMAVIGMATETNKLVSGYQVEIDEKFMTIPPKPYVKRFQDLSGLGASDMRVNSPGVFRGVERLTHG